MWNGPSIHISMENPFLVIFALCFFSKNTMAILFQYCSSYSSWGLKVLQCSGRYNSIVFIGACMNFIYFSRLSISFWVEVGSGVLGFGNLILYGLYKRTSSSWICPLLLVTSFFNSNLSYLYMSSIFLIHTLAYLFLFPLQLSSSSTSNAWM